ncbi:prepilin-type N-terminal cleavage/methylation domain-containing protein [Geomonas sp. Red69]|uniref:Prepilin-type N-terminal cleavage/methylation domain-containing protein n=1 Tax=Geomonas diazotrophica TaxID=2843197 RepID=A0ABX8JFW9_9BACT|nr:MULTISPECIES: prepilin-type N-terminal cleavage/methylation domain-containing protein [Geomonas]MBU5636143.1 prepilin-type N-terminal cleavage/methylation domain-containing protein [Geomonas diazotrophica]QWV96041.1 prepilin-type N-terminal cleavage/methylation domain-containing protein [Geomonas nitrogeniifigens]QXE85109.1 prepilin-type N-terminal cleavage/methylation domain-containing protein [Geomonas nitrogeniifigens]
MTARGFSLVEMVVVVAIASVLIGLATLRFQRYLKGARGEAEISLLFSELQRSRVQAICQRRGTRVRVYPERFEVYSSQCDGDSGVKPVRVFRLTNLLDSNASGWSSGAVIDFKETGVTDDWCSICVDPAGDAGGVDSIVIAATRISVGKRDRGNDCDSENITIK